MKLPRGRVDLLRQIALFCGAYCLYRFARGQVVDDPGAAFAHARALVSAERALGVFTEPAVEGWARSVPPLLDAATWSYVNLHFVLTTVTLAFVYLCRNSAFYFVRNMFMVAMGVALVLYVAYPTAPPRLLPELGFTDPVAHLTGVKADSSTSGVLFNPYAAVPSMHVAFALMLGGAMARMSRRSAIRGVWLAYPLIVTFVVVATANHWWADAVFGALTAAASAVGAWVLATWRPEAWAFRPV